MSAVGLTGLDEAKIKKADAPASLPSLRTRPAIPNSLKPVDPTPPSALKTINTRPAVPTSSLKETTDVPARPKPKDDEKQSLPKAMLNAFVSGAVDFGAGVFSAAGGLYPNTYKIYEGWFEDTGEGNENNLKPYQKRNLKELVGGQIPMPDGTKFGDGGWAKKIVCNKGADGKKFCFPAAEKENNIYRVKSNEDGTKEFERVGEPTSLNNPLQDVANFVKGFSPNVDLENQGFLTDVSGALGMTATGVFLSFFRKKPPTGKSLDKLGGAWGKVGDRGRKAWNAGLASVIASGFFGVAKENYIKEREQQRKAGVLDEENDIEDGANFAAFGSTILDMAGVWAIGKGIEGVFSKKVKGSFDSWIKKNEVKNFKNLDEKSQATILLTWKAIKEAEGLSQKEIAALLGGVTASVRILSSATAEGVTEAFDTFFQDWVSEFYGGEEKLLEEKLKQGVEGGAVGASVGGIIQGSAEAFSFVSSFLKRARGYRNNELKDQEVSSSEQQAPIDEPPVDETPVDEQTVDDAITPPTVGDMVGQKVVLEGNDKGEGVVVEKKIDNDPEGEVEYHVEYPDGQSVRIEDQYGVSSPEVSTDEAGLKPAEDETIQDQVASEEGGIGKEELKEEGDYGQRGIERPEIDEQYGDDRGEFPGSRRDDNADAGATKHENIDDGEKHGDGPVLNERRKPVGKTDVVEKPSLEDVDKFQRQLASLKAESKDKKEKWTNRIITSAEINKNIVEDWSKSLEVAVESKTAELKAAEDKITKVGDEDATSASETLNKVYGIIKERAGLERDLSQLNKSIKAKEKRIEREKIASKKKQEAGKKKEGLEKERAEKTARLSIEKEEKKAKIDEEKKKRDIARPHESFLSFIEGKKEKGEDWASSVVKFSKEETIQSWKDKFTAAKEFFTGDIKQGVIDDEKTFNQALQTHAEDAKKKRDEQEAAKVGREQKKEENAAKKVEKAEGVAARRAENAAKRKEKAEGVAARRALKLKEAADKEKAKASPPVKQEEPTKPPAEPTEAKPTTEPEAIVKPEPTTEPAPKATPEDVLKISDDDILSSKGGREPTGNTIAKTKRVLREHFNDQSLGSEGSYVRFVSSHPDPNVKAFYRPKENTVFLVAPRIPVGQEVGTFLHEVGVHYGLRRMVGAKVFDEVKKIVRESKHRRAEDARAAVPIDTKARYLDEEAVGYFIEQNPHIPIVRKVISKIRGFLRRAGLNIRLSLDEIRMMVHQSARNAMSGSARGVEGADLYSKMPGFSYKTKVKQKKSREEQVKGAAQAVSNIIRGSLTKGTKAIGDGLLDVSAIVESARRDGMPIFEKWVDSFNKMQDEMAKNMIEGDKTITGILDFVWNGPTRKAFVELAHASTSLGIHPGEAKFVIPKGASIKERDAAIKKNNEIRVVKTLYEKLGKDGRKAYNEVVDVFRDFWESHIARVEEAAGRMKSEKAKGEVAELIKKLKAERIDPYFPLRTFGEFGLTWSKEGEDSKTQYFDNMVERNKALEELKGEGYTVSKISRPVIEEQDAMTLLRNSIAAIDAVADESLGADKYKEALQNIFDASSRGKTFTSQTQKRRLFKADFQKDFLRGIAWTIYNMARVKAKDKYSYEMQQTIKAGEMGLDLLGALGQKEAVDKRIERMKSRGATDEQIERAKKVEADLNLRWDAYKSNQNYDTAERTAGNILKRFSELQTTNVMGPSPQPHFGWSAIKGVHTWIFIRYLSNPATAVLNAIQSFQFGIPSAIDILGRNEISYGGEINMGKKILSGHVRWLKDWSGTWAQTLKRRLRAARGNNRKEYVKIQEEDGSFSEQEGKTYGEGVFSGLNEQKLSPNERSALNELRISSLAANKRNAFYDAFLNESEAAERIGEKGWRATMEKIKTEGPEMLTSLFSMMERMVRESDYMVMYRLANEGLLKKGVGEKQAHSRAIDLAKEHVRATHFNYSWRNRPKLINARIMIVASQLLSYSAFALNRIHDRGAGFLQTFSKNRKKITARNPEEAARDKAFRRSVLASTIINTTLSGSKGLISYNLAMLLVGMMGMMFWDDDDEKTPEEAFEDGMEEFVGKDAASILNRGIFVNFLAIGDRVSPAQMIPHFVTNLLEGLKHKETPNLERTVYSFFTGVSGQQAYRLLNSREDGILPFLEGVLPKLITNFFPQEVMELEIEGKMAEVYAEKDRKGNLAPILDENGAPIKTTTAENLLGKVGFPPVRVYNAKRTAWEEGTRAKRLRKRKAEISEDLKDAEKNEDGVAQEGYRDEAGIFNLAIIDLYPDKGTEWRKRKNREMRESLTIKL